MKNSLLLIAINDIMAIMEAEQYKNWFIANFSHTSSFLNGLVFMIFDCIGIMLCVGAAFFLVNAVDRSYIVFRDFINYWVYLPAFIAVFFVARLYPGITLQPAEEVRRFSLTSLFCFAGIAMSIAIETDDRDALSTALLLAVPIATIILPLLRELVRMVFAPASWWGIPVVIYASQKNIGLVTDRLLKKKTYGYRPAVIIAYDVPEYFEYKGIPVFKPSTILNAQISACKITTIVIIEDSFSVYHSSSIESILSAYRYVITVPRHQALRSVSLSVRDFGGLLGFSATNRLKRPINLFIKRFIDLFILICSAPIIIPLVIILAILVKLTSKGPVFYGHKRIGKDGAIITTWKFRSMVINADSKLEELLKSNPEFRSQWEKNQKLENDPRITPLGKFLRKTSLDELPQFFNILLGQMSFVGPRPIVEAEKLKYGASFNYIFSVTPGLSGMWQISGRSDTGYSERIILDTFYIQNWSIWLDIWIILQTFVVVITGKGAY